MITLHTMPGTSELESLSPFCTKVEVYLKVQRIPYRTKLGDPRAAPKRKLPFLVDGTTTVADSTAILEHLERQSDHPLDRGLDPRARARSHVLQRTFEESLYWPLLWSRWGDDDGWLELGPRVAAVVPAAVRWFVPGMIRRKITGSMVAQGIGRHARDEIYAIGAADLAAIAVLLGDASYLIDDQLRTIDVTAYAFLANILLWPRPSPLTTAARALPPLEAYMKRVGARVKAAATASPPAASG